ncbi:phage portal protein [Pseudomonas plecoglossicida]|uniref:phage portal protein n=1 Tax=Pseudomonas plecoglossicida TaxID=70775 RepID=UPI00051D9B38|nr:phage portal protein [Pseudomonas plecoglossicida]KGK24355.1 phage portal protein [Pseudomonas plecoglossicida]
MNLRELEVQAKALAPVLKGLVDKALAAFRGDLGKDLDERDAGLRNELAEAVKGVPSPDVEVIAAQAAKLVPTPENGKDADPEVMRQAVADEVAKLPVPKDGESVTVEDVAPMIRDAVQEAVAALPPAEPGVSVTAEDLRPLIAEELAKAMAGLEPPKDGEPGRDALQLEILPEIDLEKPQVRGTFAKHAGGLWRAFERTHGLKGWECIVEGLAGVEIEQSGERGLDVALTLSSGSQVRKALQLPVMIYRGVFAPGDYVPGDTVTWGGSLWHCDEPTTDKPGEAGSKGWTLAAKRGRDGKDGTNGKDLTKGVSAS